MPIEPLSHSGSKPWGDRPSPNISPFLLWTGVALIALDNFGLSAAGVVLIVGWFVGVFAGGRRDE